MPNAAQLRAFHAVATEGSFTRAAEALRVTQPTVSSQVKALEDSYGVRLFDRSGRRVVATDIGRCLHAVTQRLFSLEQEAEEILAAARELESGSLRIGADGPHHAIPLVAAFSQRYPGVDVSIDMGNADEVLRDLTESRTDVAVVAGAIDDPRLHAIVYRRSRLVLIAARTHRLARRSRVRLADLATERLILRERGSVTRAIFEAALALAGIEPNRVMQIESREAVRQAVAAGLGLGVVSEAEMDPDRRLRALPFADAPLAITEHVVCLGERRRLRAVAAFLEIAGETAPG